MELTEARQKFIQGWGQLGASWGINRTMAQIQAVLLLATDPMSTDDIMADLQISRGNANMNIRELIAWGIVYKAFKPGDRKEYYYSEKSMWELAKKVSRERKKRELEPLLKMLDEVKSVKGSSAEAKEFKKVAQETRSMASRAESVLDMVMKLEENRFFKWLLPK
ncbi:MAG: transcriptional regulator [Flavobacteriales bacterium]|nr:transcriptional regulator [Bacteroidota bacterium]MCB9240517.1 transcriptional regulator [Flavobacteriales bacterium]